MTALSYRKDKNMWRERIIEAKKSQNISPKTMSERTGGHLPERTIIRILNGETEFPRIDTILELGQSVGLTAQEVFAETNSVVSDYDVAVLQVQLEAQAADKKLIDTEIATLQDTIATLNDTIASLTAENDILKLKLDHKDEIIRLHNRYTAYIDGLVKNN
jgi:transcriptional regulator with XRE-family HTH domain